MRQCSNIIEEHVGGGGDWLTGMDNEFMNKYENWKVRNLKQLKLRDNRVKLTQMGVQGNQLTKL